MTRKEAMEYNDSLKKELKQAALQCGLEESAGTYIVDNFITVLPEDARKGMIFLGEDSASYKNRFEESSHCWIGVCSIC